MKQLLLITLMAILLTSCAPAPGPVSTATVPPAPTATQTPQPSATFTPAPTATPMPTSTATAEPTCIAFDLPSAYQPFEAQWPLALVEQTGGYILHCAIDTGKLQYAEIRLPGGQLMKSWTACYFTTPQGKTDYIHIPIFIEDHQVKKMFLIFSTGPSRLAGSGYLLPALKKSIEEGWLPYAAGTKTPGIFVVAVHFNVDASSQVTPGQEFNLPLFRAMDTTGLADFARTGSTANLPALEGMDHFLPADALYFDIAR